MSNAKTKSYFRCSECRAKTSTTNAGRAAAKVCVNCRPDLDARPAPKAKATKPAAPRVAQPVAAEATPTFERMPGTLADARRLIGANADFEGFRAEGNAVMYVYEEPAEAPARCFSLAMAKRRLNTPQFNMKFANLRRQGKMVGTQVREIMLDPAAPENAVDADAAPVSEAVSESNAPTTPTVDSPAPEIPAIDAPADTPATVVPSKRKKASALDAAALVLREAGEAMSPMAVWLEIQRRNLWASPNGKTPGATIAAAMLRESVKLGAQSRFLRTERGKFAANPDVA